MRKVVVYYRDAMDHYREEYCTNPIPGNKAVDMKRILNVMGCEDIRIEPFKEAKAA